jgi:hypothetical protein
MSNAWPTGLTIKHVRLLTDEETAREDWRSSTAALVMSDGSLLYASQDPEGNDAGALFGIDPGGVPISIEPERV